MGITESESNYQVSCDNCKKELGKYLTFDNARSYSLSQGWKCKAGDWLCSKCLKPKNPHTTPLRNPVKRKYAVLKRSSIKKNPDYKIPQKTEKQIKREIDYDILRKAQLEKVPICEFPGCKKIASEVHHVRGREGVNLFGPFKSLCTTHHAFIESGRIWAKENGFSETRHKKNDNG